LTLTPMLCSRFVKPPSHAKHGRLYAASQRFFDGMLRVYDWSLQHVLRHRRLTLAVSGVVLVATALLFVIIVPPHDTDSGHER